MSNLIDKLGYDFFSSSFRSCMFMYKDEVHQFVLMNEASVGTHRFNEETQKIEPSRVPFSFFTDFSVFRIPPLGYRNARLDNNALFLESARSTNRGFRSNLVTFRQTVASDNQEFNRDSLDFGRICFKPNFTPYHVGVRKILEGDSLAFALNKDAAVAVDLEGISPMVLLFREKQAGTIDLNGRLELTNKILMRSSLYTQYYGGI